MKEAVSTTTLRFLEIVEVDGILLVLLLHGLSDDRVHDLVLELTVDFQVGKRQWLASDRTDAALLADPLLNGLLFEGVAIRRGDGALHCVAIQGTNKLAVDCMGRRR